MHERPRSLIISVDHGLLFPQNLLILQGAHHEWVWGSICSSNLPSSQLLEAHGLIKHQGRSIRARRTGCNPDSVHNGKNLRIRISCTWFILCCATVGMQSTEYSAAGRKKSSKRVPISPRRLGQLGSHACLYQACLTYPPLLLKSCRADVEVQMGFKASIEYRLQ